MTEPAHMAKLRTAKKNRLRLYTAALWSVCLTPIWAALYSNPATFWQTGCVGCAQVILGLVAVGGTILIHDG